MAVQRHGRSGLKTLGVAAILSLVGCDRATNPPDSRGPAAPNAGVRVDQNGARVDVERGDGRKPAVDVNVKPQGGVDVNVDRDKLRERIDERREERATEK